VTEPEPLEFLDNVPIDWSRIGRAVEFYRSLGYAYAEAPWVVPAEIVRETLPPGATPYQISVGDRAFGELVGSAEQSFLWLLRRMAIDPVTPIVGVSPCFRGDPRSAIHQKTFMKVELFVPNPDPQEGFSKLIADAAEFFHEEGASMKRVITQNGNDLYVGGIEVGSYGVRSVPGPYDAISTSLKWAYGTGLAEPRFSQALVEQNRK